MDSMEILNRIERGEMAVRDGLSLIEKGRESTPGPLRRGNFIKIKIIDEGHRFSFIVPIFVISMGLSLTRFAASAAPDGKMDDSGNKALNVIKSLDKKDIKRLMNELRMCKFLNFVEVHSNDSHVSISIV